MSFDRILPKANFIAIHGYSGAGANFLSAWCTLAREGQGGSVPLGPSGQVNQNWVVSDHKIIEDLEFYPDDNPLLKLHSYGRIVPRVEDLPTPWFLPDYNRVLDTTVKYIEKVIHISYAPDQEEKMSRFWMAFDAEIYPDIAALTTAEWEELRVLRQRFVRVNNQKRLPKEETASLINVAFETLLTGSADELIAKISTFTGISQANFNRTNLADWRDIMIQSGFDTLN
jgi:hypothetical protein